MNSVPSVPRAFSRRSADSGMPPASIRASAAALPAVGAPRHSSVPGVPSLKGSRSGLPSPPELPSPPDVSALRKKPIGSAGRLAGSVRSGGETPDSGRTVWTDVYPYGYGERPPAAEIYVHMRARPLIAVTTSELRRPDDGGARPQGESPKLEVALATLYPEAIERAGGIPVIVPLLRPTRSRRCSTASTACACRAAPTCSRASTARSPIPSSARPSRGWTRSNSRWYAPPTVASFRSSRSAAACSCSTSPAAGRSTSIFPMSSARASSTGSPSTPASPPIGSRPRRTAGSERRSGTLARGQLVPPPGGADARQGPCGHRLGDGRHDRGGRELRRPACPRASSGTPRACARTARCSTC